MLFRSLGNTHFKHLMVRGGRQGLWLAFWCLWELECHALVGAHMRRTRNHYILIVNCNSKLLTWSDIRRYCNNIAVFLLAGSSDHQAISLVVVRGTSHHHLLSIHKNSEVLARPDSPRNRHIESLLPSRLAVNCVCAWIGRATAG